MNITDFKYFRTKMVIGGRVALCGEYGKCAVCGKKSSKTWLGMSMIQQYHFCSTAHFQLFLDQALGVKEYKSKEAI